MSANKFLLLAMLLSLCLLTFEGVQADNQPAQFWKPQSYPSLSPLGAFHIFDSNLIPITPSLEEQQLMLSLTELAFCGFDGIDLKDNAAIRYAMLNKCERAIGRISDYQSIRFFNDKNVDDLLSNIEIISHHQNDSSGFSATLVRLRGSRKQILAIRGLELKPAAIGGDQERDMNAIQHIQRYGIAHGQLRSAEGYLSKLLKDGTIEPSERIIMAGEGLGAHLAFLLNDLCPQRTDKIVSFYGIGIPVFDKSGKCTIGKSGETIDAETISIPRSKNIQR